MSLSKSKKKPGRNSFEQKVIQQLTDYRVSFAYEPIKIPYVTEAMYLPDFIVNGTIIVETKGHFDKDDRRKMRDVKRCNPKLDIRLVFQKDNKISKAKRSKTYSQWAAHHGFLWAIGEIPDEWIVEFNNAPAKAAKLRRNGSRDGVFQPGKVRRVAGPGKKLGRPFKNKDQGPGV